MKKYFVVSDVHGFYNYLIKALDKAGFDENNPDHIFVSCGDLLDRGSQPVQCLQFVNGLPKDRKILICGNHEVLMDEMLKDMCARDHDYHNGTLLTVLDCYTDTGHDINTTAGSSFEWFKKWKEWKNYRKSCINFFETDKYVFVHGWIPCQASDPNPYHARNIKYKYIDDWRNGNWGHAMWINGMYAWSQGVKVLDKTIVCGHWHASFGNSKYHNDGVEFPNDKSDDPKDKYANFNPFVDDGIMAIDACTVLSHKVNCVVLEE